MILLELWKGGRQISVESTRSVSVLAGDVVFRMMGSDLEFKGPEAVRQMPHGSITSPLMPGRRQPAPWLAMGRL